MRPLLESIVKPPTPGVVSRLSCLRLSWTSGWFWPKADLQQFAAAELRLFAVLSFPGTVLAFNTLKNNLECLRKCFRSDG